MSGYTQIRRAATIPPKQLKVALCEHDYDILRCASVLETLIEALRRCAVVHRLLEPKRTFGRAGMHS